MDSETGSMAAAFSDKAVRRGFIRKVYSILAVQILITAAIVSLFVWVTPINEWVRVNDWVYIIFLVLNFAVCILLAFSEKFRREHPKNLIALGVFTVTEALMLGTISARFTGPEVFMALVITAVIVLVLTLFALQTKIDFTPWIGALIVVLMVTFLIGLMFIWWAGETMALIYCGIGAVVFGLFIVIDTQLMLGGKHSYTMDPEEYIFAALNLYLDIIIMFKYILYIIGLTRD